MVTFQALTVGRWMGSKVFIIPYLLRVLRRYSSIQKLNLSRKTWTIRLRLEIGFSLTAGARKCQGTKCWTKQLYGCCEQPSVEHAWRVSDKTIITDDTVAMSLNDTHLMSGKWDEHVMLCLSKDVTITTYPANILTYWIKSALFLKLSCPLRFSSLTTVSYSFSKFQ
jgi:hypothetical protein